MTAALPRGRQQGRFALGAALFLTVLGTSASVGQPSQRDPLDRIERIEDRVTVVERGVLVEMPTLDNKAVSSLVGADLVIEEGDELRDLVRITPLDPTTEPWSVLIYFDLLLSDEALVRRAAVALAARSATLVRLGEVHVVAAAAERTVLTSTNSPEELARALEDLGASRSGSDVVSALRSELSRDDPREILGAEVSFLRERADTLLVTAAEACSAPPCLLLLVSAGFNEALDLVYPAGVDKEVARQPLRTSREVARELAAMGWTTLALPLKEPPTPDDDQDPAPRPGAGTDYEAWKADVGGVQMGKSTGRRNRFTLKHPDVLDVHVQARLQPLEDWAEASAGAAMRLESQIDEELARLDRKWWLFFRGAAEIGATPKSLGISFAAQSPLRRRQKTKRTLGLVRDQITVRSPAFSRALATPALTGARLRSLERGHDLQGPLDIAVREQEDSAAVSPPARVVELTNLDPLAHSALEPRAQPVRISRLDPLGEVIGRSITIAAGERHSIELQPAEDGVLLVESLSDGRWGVVEVD